MNAEEKKFSDYLDTLDHDGLKRAAMDEHRARIELELRDEINKRISTEMYIQYNDLLKQHDAVLKELAGLKTLYQKEVDKNVLKTRSTFGRSTEKFTDLVKSATNKEEEFEDEAQTEHDENATSERTIDFRPKKNPKKEDGKTDSDHEEGNSKTKRKSLLKASMEKLPHELVYDIDIDSLNEMYGAGNWRIAYWHKHELLEKIPVQYYVREIYTPVISVGLDHALFTMPYQDVLMPHAYASPSLLADIIYRKFALGLPFNRQARDLMMSDVALLKQTIIHWVNTLTPELLDPIADFLTTKLVGHRYIQGDETPMQVNKDGNGHGHKGFMWVHCTSELLDCDPIIIFCYESTRGTDHLRHLFGEFLGYMTCDAYISYQVLEKENPEVTVTGCLMHCRRYFAEAFFVNDVASMTDEQIAAMPETIVLMLIRDIYIEENKLKSMDATDRLAARKEKAAPKVDALYDYIHELSESDTVYSDRLNKAITYAINQEEKIRLFLTDGNIPCDNGHSERIIRSYSVGRANWLFADTVEGAHVNATVYSIVETAKANNVNVRIYLQYILEKMSSKKAKAEPLDDAFLETMMPWAAEYKEYAKDLIASAADRFRMMFPEPEKPRTPSRKSNPPNACGESPPSHVA